MKHYKHLKVVRSKTTEVKKRRNPIYWISFMILLSFFIITSVQNNLLFLTEMLIAGGIFSFLSFPNLTTLK
ncbi:MAG: hypothetical protein MK202_09080 [Tenacibaculum sp.]|nr:hypothetical protein [Tenacibaculum sp.]